MDYLDELIEDRKVNDPFFAQVWAAIQLVDELAKRREAMGLSQQEIADRMGVARSRISEIEHHPERVSFARVLSYANSVGAQFAITGPLSTTISTTPSKGRPVVASGAKYRAKASRTKLDD